MKKRIVRITAALCTAALLAGCGGSISSKDGGYYTTEAAAQESYNYDSAAGSVDSGLVPENAAEAATDETAQKIIYNASLSMESTDFDTTREALMTAVEANGAWLESTSLYGTEKDHDRTADYTVRVPVGSYRAFLACRGRRGQRAQHQRERREHHEQLHRRAGAAVRAGGPAGPPERAG